MFRAGNPFISLCVLALLVLLAACGARQPLPAHQSKTPTAEPPTPTAAPTLQPANTATSVLTSEPTPEPTLSPAERNYEWTDEEAVTVRMAATEEEIQKALEQLLSRFPLTYSEARGAYGTFCLIESISFLKEGHYVNVGDFDIRVTAQCSYLDVSNEKQTVTVALVVENRAENTAWTPKFGIMDATFAPSFIQEFFEKSEDIKPGSVINVVFGLPNEVNQNIQVSTEGAVHHGSAMGQLHSAEEISAYTITGNPEALGNPLILSFSSQVFP